MGIDFPDPFDAVRRLITKAAADLLDRAVASVTQAATSAVRQRVRSLAESIEYVTAVLGRLPHATANIVADSFRGLFHRALAPAEIALIDRAFGKQPVLPSQVRVVNGPGNQPLAVAAFLNGNPAITVGNTIYIRRSERQTLGGNDMASNPDGVEMLLHEYTHVVQYARLGFAAFGRRYAREFRANGGDANKMYDHKSRRLHFDDELIEGQAAIVGDLGQQMALPAKNRNEALIRQLRAKLRGTGILGQ